MKTEVARVDLLGSLFKGEISAKISCEEIIKQISKTSDKNKIYQIGIDHDLASKDFEKEMRRLGSKPPKIKKTTSHFVKAMMGTSKMFGTSTSISALQEGEELTKQRY